MTLSETIAPENDQPADSPDPAVAKWFLSAAERGNPASDLRTWTTGNQVQPLVHGATYFAALHAELEQVEPGDRIYFVDFRGDMTEQLAGPGTEVGTVLSRLAASGVVLYGLIWRSQPGWLSQSEGANAELARAVSDAGGEILLDARTRRAGSHHQKFVVIRRRVADQDIAFVGGIDLGFSRGDTADHAGDPQVMDFPSTYGPRPPWHDVQASLRGPAVGDIEHTFRERWTGSSILDIPSPVRMLIDRAYHAGRMVGQELPERPADPPRRRQPRRPGAADLSRPAASLPVRPAR